MKRKWFLGALLIGAAVSAFAQSRDNIRIFIPPVTAVSPEQSEFFRDNFAMEVSAVGYTVTENADEADYTMALTVRPNMILWDDGVEEPAPPDEPQFILQINLLRNSDNVTVVSFSFSFTELNEMYEYNLLLVYKVMANVPMTMESGKEEEPVIEYIYIGEDRPEENWWRNNWLYLRVSFDYMTGIYLAINEPSYFSEPRSRPIPGATIGLELQFFNWMSAEFLSHIWFGDVIKYDSFIPAIGLQLKFPIKPSRHFMLEPYLAGSFSMDKWKQKTNVKYVLDADGGYPFLVSAGAGFQFGVKSGKMGALFLDLIGLYLFSKVESPNPYASASPNSGSMKWNQIVVGVNLGYKIGFFTRKKP